MFYKFFYFKVFFIYKIYFKKKKKIYFIVLFLILYFIMYYFLIIGIKKDYLLDCVLYDCLFCMRGLYLYIVCRKLIIINRGR